MKNKYKRFFLHEIANEIKNSRELKQKISFSYNVVISNSKKA